LKEERAKRRRERTEFGRPASWVVPQREERSGREQEKETGVWQAQQIRWMVRSPTEKMAATLLRGDRGRVI
jgi:hypothetical protein